MSTVCWFVAVLAETIAYYCSLFGLKKRRLCSLEELLAPLAFDGERLDARLSTEGTICALVWRRWGGSAAAECFDVSLSSVWPIIRYYTKQSSATTALLFLAYLDSSLIWRHR